jgi:hypothetical protein
MNYKTVIILKQMARIEDIKKTTFNLIDEQLELDIFKALDSKKVVLINKCIERLDELERGIE